MVTGVSRFSKTRPRSAPSRTRKVISAIVSGQGGDAERRQTADNGRASDSNATDALIACGQKQGQAAEQKELKKGRKINSRGGQEDLRDIGGRLTFVDLLDTSPGKSIGQ